MQASNNQLRRRAFLGRGLAAGAAAAVAPVVIPSSALGLDGAVPPSERIRVGGIGIGRRGEYDLGCFLQQPDVQFVAVCDVKANRRAAVKGIVDKHHGTADCHTYQDFHELLDQADIDAVLIATGPNWHGLMAMLAAKAGKDIYCEKPCTKNIAESLVLRDTMRRCGTVFQAGTQRRNLPHFAFACELARTGRLGAVKRIYAHPAGMRAMTSGWLPEDPAPDSAVADWDMYLGPAAWRPFHAKTLEDGFNFEKGGGLVGGGVLEWGSHCVDLCQWAVDDRAGFPWDRARSASKVRPAGSKRATAARSFSVRPSSWPGEKSLRSAATPRRSTSVTSSTAAGREASPRATPTPPATRTSPVMPPISPCSSGDR